MFNMRRVVFGLVLFASGCGGHFQPGDRAILLGGTFPDKMLVQEMPSHNSPTLLDDSIYHIIERPTSEFFPSGTEVSIVYDDPKETKDYRKVQIRILDGPLKDLTGTVRRKDLKAR